MAAHRVYKPAEGSGRLDGIVTLAFRCSFSINRPHLRRPNDIGTQLFVCRHQPVTVWLRDHEQSPLAGDTVRQAGDCLGCRDGGPSNGWRCSINRCMATNYIARGHFGY